MESFDTIWRRAADRKGGADTLESQMPEAKSADELRAIPDDRWFAEITKRVFQAGFSWKVIEQKWDGFEAAFDGFVPARVAHYSDADIDRLLADPGIVRNGQKITATCQNAVFLTELAAEHGSAAAFFADYPDSDFIGLLDILKKRGSRLGGATGAFFLRFMGKPAFFLNKDVNAALIQAGVVDKAPTSKKALAAVQAAFNDWQAQSGRNLSEISRVLALSADG